MQCLYPWLIAFTLWRAGPAPAPETAVDASAEENRRALAARLALWALCAAAVFGVVCHAYFTVWALRGRPFIRWGLIQAVLKVNAAQAASLLLAIAAVAKAFPGLRLAAARGWAKAILGGRAEEMARAVADDIPEGAEVLDIGAGSGLMVERLQEQRRIRPVAFDVHPIPLGSVAVRPYDGAHLPLADRSVDVTLCISMLHHCHDSVLVLREMRRVTRGRALILEDAYDHIWHRVGTALGHIFLQLAFGMPWCTESFGTETVWRQRLAEAGWRVADFRRVRVRHGNGTPLIGLFTSTAYLIIAEPA